MSSFKVQDLGHGGRPLNGSDSHLVCPTPEVLQTACSATLGIYFLSSCTRVQAPKDRLTEMYSVFLRKLLFSFMAVCSNWHAAYVPYDAHCPGCRGCNGPLITLISQTSICDFFTRSLYYGIPVYCVHDTACEM